MLSCQLNFIHAQTFTAQELLEPSNIYKLSVNFTLNGPIPLTHSMNPKLKRSIHESKLKLAT